MRESELLLQVRDYLKIHNIFYFRVHQSLGSNPGFADIIAIQKNTGKLIALELKGDKGHLTQAQSNFLANVRDAGGIGREIRSIEDLEAAIRREK